MAQRHTSEIKLSSDFDADSGDNREVAKTKVILLTNWLNEGGAERVLVSYATGFNTISPVVTVCRSGGRMFAQLTEKTHIEVLQKRHQSLDNPIDSTDASAVSVASNSRFSNLFDRARFQTLASYLQMPHRMGRIVMNAVRLLRFAKRSDVILISSFSMETHLIGLISKLMSFNRLVVVLNVHEHFSTTLKYTYPTVIDRMALRFTLRWLFPRADRIIAISNSLKQDLVDRYPLDSISVSVAFNPVDVGNIRRNVQVTPAPATIKVGTKEYKIVFLGRLVRLKGIHHLIEAVSYLLPQVCIRLQIIGEGIEKDSLQSQCHSLNISDQVDFLGWQENPWKTISEADLMVHPALTEAFPQALIEAMSLGVPILACDCSPGIRELLRDGHVGHIVQAGDSEVLAQGISELLENTQLRSTYTKRGIERAQDFTPEITIKNYEGILQNQITRF